MARSWLPLALILSVGINVGILATLALRKSPDPEVRSTAEGPPRAGIEEPPEKSPHSGQELGEQYPARMVEHLAQRLELEGESRRRFVEIQRDFFRQQSRLRPRIQELQHRLRREVAAGDPDPMILEELLTQIHRLQFERDRLWLESILESRQLLSPEQERAYLRFLAFVTRRAIDERFPGEGPPRRRGGRRPGRD